MDRPGMGKSTLIPARKLEDWPAMMAAFADHLGIGKFGQIGVSGGGPYVLACAATMPDRLTASAVLAGMVPIPLTKAGTSGLHPLYRTLIPLRKSPAPIFSGMFRIAAKFSAGKPGSFPMSALLRSLAAEDRALLLSDPDVWEVATTSFSEAVSMKNCGSGVMADSDIYFQKPSFNPSEVTHPIHYWHGGDDRNIPQQLVEDLVAEMPTARLTLEKHLGHFSLAIHCAPAALDYIRQSSH
jgi:pimeloyl-ACP methyl ester carboxylesterase